MGSHLSDKGVTIYSLFPIIIASDPELILALLSITIIDRVYIGLSKLAIRRYSRNE